MASDIAKEVRQIYHRSDNELRGLLSGFASGGGTNRELRKCLSCVIVGVGAGRRMKALEVEAATVGEPLQ